jgi:hypothetical protein
MVYNINIRKNKPNEGDGLMINEVEKKRLQKKLEELDVIVNECIKQAKHIPDEVRTEYKELAAQYNSIIDQSYQERSKDFLDIINKPFPE